MPATRAELKRIKKPQAGLSLLTPILWQTA
jgi:hypothetical protein